ncbi:MAG: tetratricopeptide repeat protein [Gammaproteobacteria bacterium]|nr:tetratricopeptide repeat protein [Gammaproteobacteria bacterium]
MKVFFRIFLPLILLLLNACSFTPVREEGFPAGASEDNSRIRPEANTSKTVLSLIKQAREAALKGDLARSEVQLERALRIEPRNAVLWHYMAKLRLNQGNLTEAAGLAAKSNSLEHNDRLLQSANWRIIAHARNRTGDLQGAQQAQDRANELTD